MTSSNPAKGLRASHYIVKETTVGVTPDNPSFTRLRYNSGTPTVSGDSSISQELNGSRDYSDHKTGVFVPNVEFACDLAAGAHSDIIKAALAGTKTTNANDTGVDITVSASGKTFTRAAGDFTSKAQVGSLVYFPSLTGDNKGPWRVKSLTATVITVDDAGSKLTDESSVTTDVGYSTTYEVGHDCETFTILSHYPDADDGNGEYAITRGVTIGTVTSGFEPNSRVSFTFTGVGLTHDEDAALPAGSTLGAAPSDKSAFHYTEGYQFIDGAETALTSVNFSLDNGISAQSELGGEGSPTFVERVRMTNTVSMSGFFRNSAEIKKFRAGTASRISAAAKDSSGNAVSFEMPAVYYTAASIELGGEGSMTVTKELRALETATEGSITIHELVAA